LNELPKPVFLAMLKTGALIPGKDDKSFDINFAVIANNFPSYLEFMVRSSLNELEQWAYVEGYMAYEILPNGLLKWKPVGKIYRKDDCF
jgi:hypothetical protein